jgi:hypothetical protein
MATGLNAAVDELEKDLEKQLQEVAATKKLINTLLTRQGQPARYTDIDTEPHRGAVRRDEYYGKPLATAVQMVLQRMRQAASLEEILVGLDKGGFDFKALKWTDNLRLRNLAISLAKNSKAFHKLPNGTFGLSDWYSDDVLRKSEKASKNGKESEEEPEGVIVEETPEKKSE